MVTCGGGPGLCATWEVSREYSGIPIPIPGIYSIVDWWYSGILGGQSGFTSATADDGN